MTLTRTGSRNLMYQIIIKKNQYQDRLPDSATYSSRLLRNEGGGLICQNNR